MKVSEFTYIVHDQPVRRSQANYLAMADLHRFGLPGQREQLWLRQHEDATYSVCCLPFWAYGLALGDAVELDLAGETISRVLRKSGHRVLRVLLTSALSGRQLQELQTGLVGAVEGTAESEWHGDRYVAIDVSPGGSVDCIDRLVRPYLSTEQVYWEWADALAFER